MAVRGSETRILLVDDDQIILDALEYGLQQANYRVEPCLDAARALASYRNSPPDLAIIDIGLPDMRGTALAQELLKYRYRPILILSSHTEPEWVDRAIGSGVIGYLVKPLSVEQLIPSIETALARFGEINQRVANNFGGSNMTVTQLVAAMDQFSFGIVIIDDEHHIVLSNFLAGQILGSEKVLLNRNGKLRSTEKKDEFHYMLDQSLSLGPNSEPSVISLRESGHGAEIQLWGKPLPSSGEDMEKSAIIVIDDPSLTTIAPSGLLKTLYGLTEKESNLAHALASGMTISQYCERVFVTPNTARSHLKSIYRKTSTNRQSELVRLFSHILITRKEE